MHNRLAFIVLRPYNGVDAASALSAARYSVVMSVINNIKLSVISAETVVSGARNVIPMYLASRYPSAVGLWNLGERSHGRIAYRLYNGISARCISIYRNGKIVFIYLCIIINVRSFVGSSFDKVVRFIGGRKVVDGIISGSGKSCSGSQMGSSVHFSPILTTQAKLPPPP